MPRNNPLIILVFVLSFVASVAVNDIVVQQQSYDADSEIDDDDMFFDWESDETVIRCRSCGAPVAYKSDYIDIHDISKAVNSRHEPQLGDHVELYTFIDPNREEVELAGFKEVMGLESNDLSKKTTIFEDYNRRDLRCSECQKPMGWVFYHNELEKCVNMQLLDLLMRKKELVPASPTKIEESKAEIVRKELEGHCLSTVIGWWTYEVCYEQEVRQFHEESDGSRPHDWSMGVFVPEASKVDTASASTDIVQRFAGGQHCDENGELRSTIVIYTCCLSRPKDMLIEKVGEPSLCKYLIRVCIPILCNIKPDEKHDSEKNDKYDVVEDEETIDLCTKQFEAVHADTMLPSAFTTLRWSSVISEDSSELDWARQMQFANHG